MQLTLWTYEVPPHVGAMRIAASMNGVHYVLRTAERTPMPICCSR